MYCESFESYYSNLSAIDKKQWQLEEATDFFDNLPENNSDQFDEEDILKFREKSKAKLYNTKRRNNSDSKMRKNSTITGIRGDKTPLNPVI